MIKAYLRGMAMLGPCSWSAVRDELEEFIEDPSIEEFFDVLHGLLRMTGVNVFGLLAWPTARKHALRVVKYGCPRSERNHKAAGDSCCCK